MLKRVVTGSAAQTFAVAAGLFDRFVITAVLLRYWGVGLFEDWALLLAAVALFGAFGLGFHNYFGNVYLFDYERQNFNRLRDSIKLAAFFHVSAFVLGIVVLLASSLSENLANKLGISELRGSSVGIVFFLLGSTVLLESASSTITELYRAHRKFARGVFISTLLILSRSISVGLVAVVGSSPVIGAVVYILFTVFFVFVAVPLDQARSLRSKQYGIKLPNRAEAIETWHGSKWYFAQNVPALLLLNLPVLFIGSVNSAPGVVAAFVMSRTITNFARQIMQNFVFVLGQELSRAYARREEELLSELFTGSSRLVCASTGAMLGLVLAVGEPFFEIWSSGAVQYHEDLMVLLALSVGLSAPTMVSLALLFYTQQARPIALARIAQGVVSLVLALSLVEPHGAVGVAMALLAGEVIGTYVFVLPAGAKAAGISVFSHITRALWYSAAGLVLCFASGMVMRTWVPQDGLRGLVVVVACLVPVFLLTVLFVGASKLYRQAVWHRTTSWLQAYRESP